MSQREISLGQLTATRASGAVVLIRLYVGLIFVGEGILKFLRPEALGPGRFNKAGIPAGTFFAYLDGVFEIGCGLLILVAQSGQLRIATGLGEQGSPRCRCCGVMPRCTRKRAVSGTSSTKVALRWRCCAAASSC